MDKLAVKGIICSFEASPDLVHLIPEIADLWEGALWAVCYTKIPSHRYQEDDGLTRPQLGAHNYSFLK